MANSQVDKAQNLNILVVPLMTQSHLIPFIGTARLLAERGLSITIVMTPLNAACFQYVINNNKHLKIHFLVLSFPRQEFGLPQGCERFDSLPSPDLIPKFFQACNKLQKPLEKWLHEESLKMESSSKPSCIISDFCLPWTENLSLKFNIPRFIFHGISCFSSVCNRKIVTSKVLERIKSDSEPFLVPDIPDQIEFTRGQLPQPIRQNSGDHMKDLVDQFQVSELSSNGILVNTFEELEPNYVKEYQNMKNKKIWCIGPVNHPFRAKTENPIKFDQEDYLMSWLNQTTKPRSVVYACFGSLSHLTSSQLKELAMGLESSNVPFIWVIRKENYYSTSRFDQWLEEENFQERLKGRGLVVRGWAPQVPILNHPAVGGFLTHCGWNSTLEGVSAGVPMMTWPMFAEQFCNEKMIVKVLKIGVRVGVEETVVVNCGRDDDEEDSKDGIYKGFVKKEDIKKAIENLMDEGGEGEEIRRRARKIGDVAKRAVQEEGSSYLNMSYFIRHISEKLASYDD